VNLDIWGICAEFFQNKLVETIQFMEVLNLKDSMEKDTFFRKLPTLAEQLPRSIVTKKVLSHLLLVLSSARPKTII
jgi:SCY1-like protein 1